MAPKKRNKGCREAKDELDLLVEHINDPKASLGEMERKKKLLKREEEKVDNEICERS